MLDDQAPSKRRVIFACLDPRRSPVGDALAKCRQLADPAGYAENWDLALWCNQQVEATVITEIWRSLLPAAARLTWKFWKEIVLGFPMRLLLAISSDSDLSNEVCEAFVALSL